jgi:hypothetical protein
MNKEEKEVFKRSALDTMQHSSSMVSGAGFIQPIGLSNEK